MTRTFVFLCLAAAACGGKSGSAAEPGPPMPKVAPCESVSSHLAELMAGQDGERIGPEHIPVLTKIYGERCAADGWAPDIIECMRAADVKTFDACAQQLTQMQRDAIEHQFERELKPLVDERWNQTHPKDDLESATDLKKTGDMPEPAPPPPPARLEDDVDKASTPPPKPATAPKRSAPRPKADDPCGGGA